MIDNKAAIVTKGGSATAVMAQSIGGGKGGATAGKPGSLTDPKEDGVPVVSIGGDGGSAGWGGDVQITSTGTISTSGDDAPALLAHIIDGGDHLAAVMTLDDSDGDGDAESETGLIPENYKVPLIIGGKDGASGFGGKATVALTGLRITTTGRDSYGVLAQSLGGGGIVGGMSDVNLDRGGNARASDGTHHGSGGELHITLDDETRVQTTGRRAWHRRAKRGAAVPASWRTRAATARPSREPGRSCATPARPAPPPA